LIGVLALVWICASISILVWILALTLVLALITSPIPRWCY
jgi:hypothetical protein